MYNYNFGGIKGGAPGTNETAKLRTKEVYDGKEVEYEGTPLSEALALMQAMARDGHLDPALFELFLSSGVCLDYAGRFMRPAQIDVQDVGSYRP